MIDWQQRVRNFMRLHQRRHDPMAHALDLASEIGEVAKEVLLATDYGAQAPRLRSRLSEELGDALYSLLALAEVCEVDIEAALRDALEKYERRIAERGEMGSVDGERSEQVDSESGIGYLEAALEPLQQGLGHDFHDLDILRRALTHPSYVNEHPEEELRDNQRLEFLGDAVLDFVAGAWVYRTYTDFDEGRMTRLRAALVRTETLARLARQVGLGELLRLGHGEQEAGGRKRNANLCDAFEAVVGALYLDGGLRAVRGFVEPLIEPVATSILETAADQDAKSRLQEWSQAELAITPRYRIVAERGPDHAKTFVAEVLLGKEIVGEGAGRSKQAAEQAAAQAAWESVMWEDDAASEALPPVDS